MRVRRLISVLAVSLVASATVVVANAQPKKDDKKAAKPADKKPDPKKGHPQGPGRAGEGGRWAGARRIRIGFGIGFRWRHGRRDARGSAAQGHRGPRRESRQAEGRRRRSRHARRRRSREGDQEV